MRYSFGVTKNDDYCSKRGFGRKATTKHYGMIGLLEDDPTS
jgi:hypothetical protein